MTAGELVVNVVLKGGQKAKETFEGINKGVKSVASSSLEAKAALIGTLYALDRLISSAGQQGSTLTQFANLTGQSTEALQRWKLAFQHTGGAAEEMQGSIQSVYSALAKQNAGLGAISGFGFVNRTMNMDMNRVRNNDVFYIMDQLKQFANTQTGKTGIGTDMLKTFGLSDSIIASFRNKDFDPSKITKGLIISDSEREKLNRMNIGLNDFWMSLKRFGTTETEIFGPSVLANMKGALSTVEKLTHAFNQLSTTQKGLGAIAGIMATLGTALAVMGGPLTAIAGAVTALTYLAAEWDKHSKGQENIFGDKNFKGNIIEKSHSALMGSLNDEHGLIHRLTFGSDYKGPSAEEQEAMKKDIDKNGLLHPMLRKMLLPNFMQKPSAPAGGSKSASNITINNHGVEDENLGSVVADTISRHAVKQPYFQSPALTQVG